jgi:hypothetical protein
MATVKFIGSFYIVMAGLVPAIHAFDFSGLEDVHARESAGMNVSL